MDFRPSSYLTDTIYLYRIEIWILRSCSRRYFVLFIKVWFINKSSKSSFCKHVITWPRSPLVHSWSLYRVIDTRLWQLEGQCIMLGNITVDIFPELFKVNRTTFSTLLLDNQERTTDSTLTYFFSLSIKIW